MTRREFLKRLGTGALFGALDGLGMLGYTTQVEPGWIEVTEVRLALKRLAPAFKGLRLVQISDIHLGNWLNRYHLDEIVKMTAKLKPDLIALTGDFMPGRGWSAQHDQFCADLEAGLKPLASLAPVFAVLGNHDYWTDADAVRSMLKGAGVMELANAVYTIRRGAYRLHICGVDDIYEEKDRLDQVVAQLGEARAGTDADWQSAILLAHEPDFADTSALTGHFDLQISGHSHGGQVVLPFIGAPLLPWLGQKYYSGLYQVGEMWQYTNRGIGMAGKMVRFNCRPEVTVFVLN